MAGKPSPWPDRLINPCKQKPRHGVHMASTPEGMDGNRHATAEAKLSRKSTGYETAANDGQQEQP
jgi:hypothetical protein